MSTKKDYINSESIFSIWWKKKKKQPKTKKQTLPCSAMKYTCKGVSICIPGTFKDHSVPPGL